MGAEKAAGPLEAGDSSKKSSFGSAAKSRGLDLGLE